ncbi:MAG TPA: Do family serine endopeptidase [Paludibacteraceae bacterium]|jgi:Do/DeqQ family serine protease|nr:Do family serine endopeptidase [Paludibacteraceae bacterium]HOU69636.1 Do family serine endopeptidase [Paludibacteraceae bacterium]HQF51276.1 Do family serine endopeptidase [Paludibacteraceae bacterium]
MKHLKFFGTIVAVALLSAGVSVFCYSQLEKRQQNVVIEKNSPVHFTSNIGSVPIDFTEAAELSVNAVVHVMTKYEPKEAEMVQDPFFQFFFGDRSRMQKPQPQVGSGSGVILTSDGYIVTNNHVVDGSDNISVILNDKRTFTAKLIGTDPTTDIALLKVDATDLPTLSIGNSDELKIGEWVLAVGNPFNLTSTVTAGIVSAKARSINILNSDMKIESFIQTDAAVNPGNSGGALVNTRGELVGINTAIASQTGSYSGYSFAIPVSIMAKVVADLKQYGTVQRALLGISINDITADFAKEKNIEILEGVYVADVNDKSAASDAGIEKGDVITHVNEVKVKSVSELQEQIGRYRPGDKVSIIANRDGKNKKFEVTLKNKMGTTNVLKNGGMDALGAKLVPLNDRQKNVFGVTGGLYVEKIEKGGRFQQAGVPKGYILVKANSKIVNSVSELEEIVNEAKQKNSKFDEQALFLSGFNPDGKIVYYAIDLKE